MGAPWVEDSGEETPAAALIGGPFDRTAQVDLYDMFGKLHPGHSGQFRSVMAKRLSYWKKLMESFSFRSVL